MLRPALPDEDDEAVPVTPVHAPKVSFPPPLHRDPFDRMLVVQARREGLLPPTADRVLAPRDGPIRSIRPSALRHP